MTTQFPISNIRSLILLVYLALAALFAVTTPAWQNPDEPAHYNYVAFVATEGRLPVLQMGDYDEAYLQRLKDEKFPAELSIAPVRYEFHQPPLYYILAAPVYWLSGGSLLALRLFSALLGAGAIWLLSLCFQTVLPDRPGVVLAATAFVAFLPMHLAILSSLNNDSLAELLIAGGLLVLLRWASDRRQPTADSTPHSALRIPHLLQLGLLIGLGFLTKATAYILLPVALITITFVIATRSFTIHNSQSNIRYFSSTFHRILSSLLLVISSALLLGLPLWLRNIATYGGLDFLGLGWHDRVVTGQPTTVDWIAANGWPAYWERAWDFTFSSFWGVFGWLGVFMDGRVYTLLLIFSGVVVTGLLAGLWRWWTADGRRQTAGRRTVIRTRRLAPVEQRSVSKPSGLDDSAFNRWGIFVALLLLAGVAASYVWYNLGFVQHQGRYLFSALFSFGLIFALGWREALRPRVSFVIAGLLFLWAVVFAGTGLAAGALDKWTLLFLAGGMGVLLVNELLERIPGGTQLRPILYAGPFVLLILLDAVIPFLYTIPQLGR